MCECVCVCSFVRAGGCVSVAREGKKEGRGEGARPEQSSNRVVMCVCVCLCDL